MPEKIYCGNAKEYHSPDGWHVLNACIDLDQLERQFDEHGFITERNGKRMIRVKIYENREPDKYGNTHSILVDTWKPDMSKSKGIPDDRDDPASPQFGDDIPF